MKTAMTDSPAFLVSSYDHAVEVFEKILKQSQEFEQKIILEKQRKECSETTDELEELCQLAADVPAIWNHPPVTRQERKEILRCLIDRIVVGATKERIDATIYWKSGQTSPILLWRDRSLQSRS